MSIINFHTKEIGVKVVYYGPGLCGKTTSLQTIYASLPPERRPQIVSLATEVDRTIFFDFLPVTAYRIRDFRVRLQLYTVPGQVFYNATRKLVLNGVDGIVFVADSQFAMKDSNLESLQNLEENLADLGLEPEQVPTILQFNKRDLPEIYSVEEMDKLYNPRQLPVFATVATNGDGLFDAMRAISQMVVNSLLRRGLGKQLGAVTPPPAEESGGGGLSESLGAAVAAATRAAAAGTGEQPTAAIETPPEVAPPAPVAQPQGTSMLEAPGEELIGTRAPNVVPFPALWSAPSGLTQAIDRHLYGGRWAEAVLATEAFVRQLANDWADSSGQGGSDPMPTYILLRGVATSRYSGFAKSLGAAKAGQPVDRDQAMNALIVALEAVW